MLPTLKPGQHCIAWPYFFSAPKKNDLVLFKNSSTQTLMVKRVSNIDQGEKGLTYQVLGDNQADSSDSRAWGSITKKQIIGKIIRFSS
jgi:hypothetical protein